MAQQPLWEGLPAGRGGICLAGVWFAWRGEGVSPLEQSVLPCRAWGGAECTLSLPPLHGPQEPDIITNQETKEGRSLFNVM